ncbi:helix-turn-helix domain-containing protein [Halalkalibacter urbisdiaboli]|uniref:helix-turn-helix domain-containing protein n=1 Tax=Halalkalibacter urbisdiaboli TaxID=1960589 RepID=UPI000B44A662|nr:helix-turn-helix domain-containing protein [Halalkalibacter urbisdiaboli]
MNKQPPLDDRHYLAIELLLTIGRRNKGLNRAAIAKQCGVSRMQLYRWEQRKDFQKALKKRTKQKHRKMFPKRTTLAEMALQGDEKSALQLLEACDLLTKEKR